MKRPLRFLGAALLGLAISPSALATWSIVVVNRATGEVGIAAATCITNFDLKQWLPVVVVGQGAGAAQSAVDNQGFNRATIWQGLQDGLTPQEILDLLAQSNSHQSRQYGLSAFSGPSVTFTGSGAGDAKHGVVGEVDGICYAIQGNVLAGDAVILEAEIALIQSQGDLVQRLMAAMEAARAFGGDGRCSCSDNDPDGCGSPPPGTWKSAHTAFIVVARHGDTDGVCNVAEGCASGSYYLARKFDGNASDPDPVIVLQQKVEEWRQSKIGKPDHILSEVAADRDAVVADGLSRAFVTVLLRDIEGTPLGHGGATISVLPVTGDPPTAVPGPVTDHGDGTYSFELVATDQPGRGAWNLVVDFGGNKPVQLWPPLFLQTSPLVDLHCGKFIQQASDAGAVPFTLNRGAGEAGRAYHLLGTTSGTTPGLDLGSVLLPLNRDRFFQFTYLSPGPPAFPGSQGLLDGDGRAEAALVLPPVAWSSLVGERLHFCALLGGPTLEVTALAQLDVWP